MSDPHKVPVGGMPYPRIELHHNLMVAAALAGLLMGPIATARADQALPFEGTWVRADRVCTAAAPSARTYSGRILISPSGRCTLRNIAFGAGEYEISEECHRAERSGNVFEKIRMLGPDAMVLKYQVNRLKIPRGRRFVRCTIAATKPAVLLPGRLPVSPAPKPGIPTTSHDLE